MAAAHDATAKVENEPEKDAEEDKNDDDDDDRDGDIVAETGHCSLQQRAVRKREKYGL